MSFLRTRVWFIILAMSVTHAFAQVPFATSCGEDAQIQAARKKLIDSAAMNFVQTVLGASPSAAFDLMSKEGQTETNRQQMNSMAAAIRQFQAQNVTLQHTYLIKLTGKSPGRIVCATDVSKPEGWVSLTADSIPEQAYALLSADARNNKVAFVVWLVPEQNEWKIQSFYSNISTLADMDSLQLWKLARAQQDRHHGFNAALLYSAAAQVANRGPNFQWGVTQSISTDMAKLAPPDEVKGAPPFLWKNGESTYKVRSVGPIAIGGKLYVLIVHETLPWQSEAQVDGWNKELLKYFKSRFPEYSDVFAGLLARAAERGSKRLYTTVEELSPAKKQSASR